jgi:hypothetical protein
LLRRFAARSSHIDKLVVIFCKTANFSTIRCRETAMWQHPGEHSYSGYMLPHMRCISETFEHALRLCHSCPAPSSAAPGAAPHPPTHVSRPCSEISSHTVIQYTCSLHMKCISEAFVRDSAPSLLTCSRLSTSPPQALHPLRRLKAIPP